MKKSLKITLAIVAVLVIAFLAYFVGSGFVRCSTAWPMDYSVSEDGSKMTIKVVNISSIGYIREPKIHVEDGIAYLDFYNGFGGINGSIGAMQNNSCDVDLDGINTIAINRGDKYETAFSKTVDGEWEFVKQTTK